MDSLGILIISLIAFGIGGLTGFNHGNTENDTSSFIMCRDEEQMSKALDNYWECIPHNTKRDCEVESVKKHCKVLEK